MGTLPPPNTFAGARPTKRVRWRSRKRADAGRGRCQTNGNGSREGRRSNANTHATMGATPL
eukprot:6590231-Lingulodinium_polyedra.AAC.1